MRRSSALRWTTRRLRVSLATHRSTPRVSRRARRRCQGAHVIAISELPTVDAVVLLASPVFAPNDATAKSGSFNPEQGGLIEEVPIDGPLADRTIQVCISGDPICQFGSIAFWVHSGSYFGDALAEAADFAADRLP